MGNKTGIICGTGPSVTQDQLEIARFMQSQGALLFGMNHIWKELPVDVFLACNPEYYDLYWERGLKDHSSEKWTWDKATAEKYDINFIKGRWSDGFSTDPQYLHYGHSSGFQLPGIAYHYGVRKMLLIGYDMAYAYDYNGKNSQIGSTPRHYFGEYDAELQHWPSVKIKNGVFTELIEQFEKVKEINTDIEIINCTPNSAMTCFPMIELNECLSQFT